MVKKLPNIEELRDILEEIREELDIEAERRLRSLRMEILKDNQSMSRILDDHMLERYHTTPSWMQRWHMKGDVKMKWDGENESGSEAREPNFGVIEPAYRRWIVARQPIPTSRFWLPIKNNFDNKIPFTMKFYPTYTDNLSQMVDGEDEFFAGWGNFASLLENRFIDAVVQRAPDGRSHELDEMIFEILSEINPHCSDLIDISEGLKCRDEMTLDTLRRKFGGKKAEIFNQGIDFETSSRTLLDTPELYLCRTCWRYNCSVHGKQNHSVPKVRERIGESITKEGDVCGENCYRRLSDENKLFSASLAGWSSLDCAMVDSALDCTLGDICLTAALCCKPCSDVWSYFNTKEQTLAINGVRGFLKKVNNGKSREIDISSSEPRKPCHCSKRCNETCKCGKNCEIDCTCPASCTYRYQGCNCSNHSCTESEGCSCCLNRRFCDADLCACKGSCNNSIPTNKDWKRLLIGESDISGFGCFAGEDIFAEEFICEYIGEGISNTEAELRGRVYRIEETTSGFGNFLFTIDKNKTLDSGRSGSKIRFANHEIQRKANCKTVLKYVNGVGKICVYAKKDIRLGQELTFDYGDHYQIETENGHDRTAENRLMRRSRYLKKMMN